MTRATTLGGLALAAAAWGCSGGDAPVEGEASRRGATAAPGAERAADDAELTRLRERLDALEREDARLRDELAQANARLGVAAAWLAAAGFPDAERVRLPDVGHADGTVDVDRLRARLRALESGAHDAGVSGWVHGTTYPAAWLAPDER